MYKTMLRRCHWRKKRPEENVKKTWW